MNERVEFAPAKAREAQIEEVYNIALAENETALKKAGPEKVKEIINGSLERMGAFAACADKDRAEGLKIDRETAERIGSIWIFSGVGMYDTPLKKTDNPALIKPFLFGSNRKRIDHAVLLARRIAEVRSGKQLKMEPGLGNMKEYQEAMRELLLEYGPHIVFGGYEDENQDVENVLERDGIIIPQEKVSIIRKRASQ